MSTTQEPKLARRTRAALAVLAAITVLLVISVVLALWKRRVEERKRRQTEVILAQLRTLVDFNLKPPRDDEFFFFHGVAGPVSVGETPDAEGQIQFRNESAEGTTICEWHHGTPEPEEWMLERGRKSISLDDACRDLLRRPRKVVLDGWGNAIRYRHPGVVHKHGWDLNSVGPNGVDENGEGDDILVGEDVGAVTTGS